MRGRRKAGGEMGGGMNDAIGVVTSSITCMFAK